MQFRIEPTSPITLLGFVAVWDVDNGDGYRVGALAFDETSDDPLEPDFAYERMTAVQARDMVLLLYRALGPLIGQRVRR